MRIVKAKVFHFQLKPYFHIFLAMFDFSNSMYISNERLGFKPLKFLNGSSEHQVHNIWREIVSLALSKATVHSDFFFIHDLFHCTRAYRIRSYYTNIKGYKKVQFISWIREAAKRVIFLWRGHPLELSGIRNLFLVLK